MHVINVAQLYNEYLDNDKYLNSLRHFLIHFLVFVLQHLSFSPSSLSFKLNSLSIFENSFFFARNNPSISFFQAETSLSIFEEFDIFLLATMEGEEVGPAIGIDLGTTHSCVAVCKHGGVKIIPNDQGYRTTPSYVAFTDYELLVGNEAKNQVAMNPSNTVFGKVSNMTIFSNLFIRKRPRFDVASEIRFVEDCHVKENGYVGFILWFFFFFSASCVFFAFLSDEKRAISMSL